MAVARKGRPARKKPAELVTGWPDETSADPVVEVARQLALNVRSAIAGQSVRAVATRAEVDYTSLYAILNGSSWPDLATIARLEHGLGVDLYPAGIASRSAKCVTE